MVLLQLRDSFHGHVAARWEVSRRSLVLAAVLCGSLLPLPHPARAEPLSAGHFYIYDSTAIAVDVTAFYLEEPILPRMDDGTPGYHEEPILPAVMPDPGGYQEEPILPAAWMPEVLYPDANDGLIYDTNGVVIGFISSP